MKKVDIKRMFKAIEDDDRETLDSILDQHEEAIEAHGFHNRLVRDKTPLMYSLQCFNLKLAGHLLDRGANPFAVMPDGPRHSVILMCIERAFCNKRTHDDWIAFTIRLLDLGVDPNKGLWPSLHGYGELVPRDDLIRIMLERGADPDRKVGNCGHTVRELVQINSRLYPPEVLELFGVDANEPPIAAIQAMLDQPTMEYFFHDYGTGQRVDSSDPFDGEPDEIMKAWGEMSAAPRSFFGVVVQAEETLQFRWEDTGELLVDIPVPPLGGSRQLYASGEFCRALLERSINAGQIPEIDGLEFQSW